MKRDLAHMQLSDLQGEMRPICRTSDYREKESICAERNGYYSYCNNVKKIVLRASICIFFSYFLFVDASLTIHAQVSTFSGFEVQNYRVVGRPSYKKNIRPPFSPVIRI